MIERFEALAKEFLTQAEGGTQETRNSRWEQRAAMARAAAECTMAAVALKTVEPIETFRIVPERCTVNPTHVHEYTETTGGLICKHCCLPAPLKGVTLDG